MVRKKAIHVFEVFLYVFEEIFVKYTQVIFFHDSSIWINIKQTGWKFMVTLLQGDVNYISIT